MLYPFFVVAMRSPGRQSAFRWAAVGHVLLVAALVAVVQSSASGYLRSRSPLPILGHGLLVAGLIEGAALIGWRLTQLPKSQALEFILVSPVQPRRFFLAEAAVGVARLALVTLAGVPVLGLLVCTGRLVPEDLVPLLVMPFTWGVLTGLGLTVWAYESVPVRRWGELVGLSMVVGYLAVGVLIGENIDVWLQRMSPRVAYLIWDGVMALHTRNPFAALQSWLGRDREIDLVWGRLIDLELLALLACGLALMRAACRLKGHFHDRHYRPIRDGGAAERGRIGDRPLAWWAVRRVMEYSGRVNIWLAGGFGLIYAAYLLAGPAWPPWLGRLVLHLFDTELGGPAGLTAGLVVLAAVPAAFQYGLWDSSPQERCRRLELLLLTRLDASDFWGAAVAAAWRRGRGYFVVAVLIWGSAVLAGRADVLQALAALAAAVVLWGFSFAVGFRAFACGEQANGLGVLLTLGLPLATLGMVQLGLGAWATLIPPGAVYLAIAGVPSPAWALGPLLVGGGTLWLMRSALGHCEEGLRCWYDRNQGRR